MHVGTSCENGPTRVTKSKDFSRLSMSRELKQHPPEPGHEAWATQEWPNPQQQFTRRMYFDEAFRR